jgi:hypothetical protein
VSAVPEAKRAVPTVPLEIFEAFKLVSADPSPVTVVSIAVLAVKLPEASRAIIVEAPLAEAAVVLALSIVPLDIAVAFKLVMFAPEKAAVLDPVPPLATGKTPNIFDSKLA